MVRTGILPCQGEKPAAKRQNKDAIETSVRQTEGVCHGAELAPQTPPTLPISVSAKVCCSETADIVHRWQMEHLPPGGIGEHIHGGEPGSG